MTTHVMLDLETMGTGPDAAVVAIGAAVVQQLQITHTFYRQIYLPDVVKFGCKIDAKTVLWWLEREEAARREVYTSNSINDSAYNVLNSFSEFIRSLDDANTLVWGNGSDFDNVILTNLYKLTELPLPWIYRHNRCYRTLCSIYPNVVFVKPKIKHHALEDAIAQAQHLIKILSIHKG